jgi:hypothetical protein
MRFIRRALLGLMVAIALTACSGMGSRQDTRPGTSEQAPQAAVDSHPSASTLPRLAIPVDASEVSTAVADVDGDGRPEMVATYRSPDGRHHLLTQTAAGDTSSIELRTQSRGVDPIVAVGDIGAGGETVFVETTHTTSAFEIVPYAFTDGDWSVIEAATEGSPRLPIVLSGAAGDVYGMSCRLIDDTPGLTLASITQTQGGFLLTTTEYRLAGTTLIQVGIPIVHGAIIPTRDLSIDDAESINCPRGR